jgi:hypothetical protein
MTLEGQVLPESTTISTCFPQAVAPVTVVIVIVLVFIVVLAILGYTPVLALSLVMATLTIVREPQTSPGHLKSR